MGSAWRAAALAALVTASASPAAATQYLCRAAAPGQGVTPTAEMIVEADGRLVRADFSWMAKGVRLFPMLILAAKVEDPAAPRLGDVDTVAVAAGISTNPIPTPANADVVVTFPDGAQLRRKWQMYAQAHAAPPPENPQGKPTVLFGVVPLAGPKPPKPKLAREFAISPTVQVRVVGDDGSVLSENAVDLTDTAARDTAIAAQFVLARAAAKDPVHKCQPFTGG